MNIIVGNEFNYLMEPPEGKAAALQDVSGKDGHCGNR